MRNITLKSQISNLKSQVLHFCFQLSAFSFSVGFLLSAFCFSLHAAVDVYIPDVPDYQWYAGCTGTASGIIMGYWDRHGFPNMYTGPTAGGVAPLYSSETNTDIRGFWVSKAGLDGRPTNQWGHFDDYWGTNNIYDNTGYEGTGPDPYLVAHRPEHTPDCIGDFIGLSQNKWTNMNNECDGNINSYAFVWWDNAGNKRVNFIPPLQNGVQPRDIPSGWRAWSLWRGYSANVFSQLTDFNPNVPAGKGFTFEDLKAEINAGYPVMLYQQGFTANSRVLPNMPKANPAIHAIVAYGYYIADDGYQWVRFRSTWADGADFWTWDSSDWETAAYLPIRGVCGYHPLPKVTSVTRANGNVTIEWHGPNGQLCDAIAGTTTNLHYYVIERSSSPIFTNIAVLTSPITAHTATVPESGGGPLFYRVQLRGK